MSLFKEGPMCIQSVEKLTWRSLCTEGPMCIQFFLFSIENKKPAVMDGTHLLICSGVALAANLARQLSSRHF